ncbi:unnamed protein product, partial [Rotaria sp. Silwood2]
MTLQQSTYSHPFINDFAREKFYETAKKHIEALNPKFRNKAVITRVQSKNIINVLQNKLSTEKVSGRFSHWCKQTFALRLIAGHQLLCDFKE